jgi:hypothetical protein
MRNVQLGSRVPRYYMQRTGMGMVYSRRDEDHKCATASAQRKDPVWLCRGRWFPGGANSLFLDRINTINNRIRPHGLGAITFPIQAAKREREKGCRFTPCPIQSAHSIRREGSCLGRTSSRSKSLPMAKATAWVHGRDESWRDTIAPRRTD